MYENIGKKIKTLATVISVILIIGSVIGGIAVLVECEGDGDGAVIGWLVMLLGPLFAWLSGFMLYGFGELVDKTCDIERILRTGAAGAKPEENVDSLPEI